MENVSVVDRLIALEDEMDLFVRWHKKQRREGAIGSEHFETCAKFVGFDLEAIRRGARASMAFVQVATKNLQTAQAMRHGDVFA